MAHWSWIEADNHIEFEYDRAGVPQGDRLPPAIATTAEPVESFLLAGYEHEGNILGRLATLGEDYGTDPRVELVFEMAPVIEANGG